MICRKEKLKLRDLHKKRKRWGPFKIIWKLRDLFGNCQYNYLLLCLSRSTMRLFRLLPIFRGTTFTEEVLEFLRFFNFHSYTRRMIPETGGHNNVFKLQHNGVQQPFKNWNIKIYITYTWSINMSFKTWEATGIIF